jgi:prepilin-type N-terminal cleavage/methylation domain-containing protein
MAARPRGFTLAEMLITVTLIAILAALAMPQFTSVEPLRARAAAGILRSDIEMAQVLCMSEPSNPVVVRFDTSTATYWLAEAGTPDTPITRADTGEPYSVTLGADRAVAAEGISISLADVPSSTLEFNSSGGLIDFTLNPVITLSGATDTVELHIAPTTGRITEQ